MPASVAKARVAAPAKSTPSQYKYLSAGFGPGGSGYPKGKQAPPIIHEGSAQGPAHYNKPPTQKLSGLTSPSNVRIPGVNAQAEGRRRQERQTKRKEREISEAERNINGGQLV